MRRRVLFVLLAVVACAPVKGAVDAATVVAADVCKEEAQDGGDPEWALLACAGAATGQIVHVLMPRAEAQRALARKAPSDAGRD